MKQHTHLYNAGFIDGLYEAFLVDPNQVGADWRNYFEQLRAELPGEDIPHAPVQERFLNLRSTRRAPVDGMASRAAVRRQVAVLQLINAYRFRGHEAADLDPLKLREKSPVPELSLEYYDLGPEDLDKTFDTGSLVAPTELPLREIIVRLEKIYCGHVGAEYMHITDTAKKRWIQERLEERLISRGFGVECKLQILQSLTAAEGLEHYLGEQYVGQKRFSLEGGESLIPLLDQLIQSAGGYHSGEVIVGMAHRGRLNVLVNVVGKKTRELFGEFEGRLHTREGSGDVKYHQGYSSDVITPGGPVHIALAFNPSHLEIINSVVEGAARARQDRRDDRQRNSVLPVLIHGDAAFSGQGVVMETLNLSQTHGYKTGGTVHIILNNQIGFTTSDPFDARSTLYCSDVAKMVRAPIFHVNGDDPEAVMFVANLALEYRMTFNMDVIIDLICYRRHGHNEVDEPAATQPAMYHKIRRHPTVWTLYAQKLINEGVISSEDAEAMMHQYKASLKTQEVVGRPRAPQAFQHGVDWKRFRGRKWTESAETAISAERLQRLAGRMTAHPGHFSLHRAVSKLLDSRRRMAAGEQPADWGFAETLAYASLLDEGYPIRLSGQDSARGTFAHRHAVLHDQKTGDMYIPLRNVSENQAHFLVINSLLSEEAVLGFEFGYSASDPDSLVIWEAQFGDFANNAQVVIDQFISSSEAKWQRFSGLTLFLPHGYDGQGPEHSSARLERFLQLCAEDNIQVCVPSTPGQFFHLIRRQVLRTFRKPLIVMTPKSLLRHKQSVSELDAFTQGDFQVIIDDPEVDPTKVRRVLVCGGQVYYKLLNGRAEREMDNVAIIRLEQLYPFPRAALANVIHRYEAAQPQWFWVQEEPRNQGAWQYVLARMPRRLNLDYAGRLASASPAAGYYATHREQEKELIAQAFDLGFE